MNITRNGYDLKRLSAFANGTYQFNNSSQEIIKGTLMWKLNLGGIKDINQDKKKNKSIYG